MDGDYHDAEPCAATKKKLKIYEQIETKNKTKPGND